MGSARYLWGHSRIYGYGWGHNHEGPDHVDKYTSFFYTSAVDNRRRHSFKLYKDRFNVDIGKFPFSYWVCHSWNHLPNDIVTASSLNIFKNKRDRHLRSNWGLK